MSPTRRRGGWPTHCASMAKADFRGPLSGHVELDETYVGGKHCGGCSKGRGASGVAAKMPVFGMLQQGGGIVAGPVSDTNKDTLLPYILTNMQRGNVVSTDEANAYKTLEQAAPYMHFVVNHSREEYVAGIHHVNSIEGCWVSSKKSIKGTSVGGHVRMFNRLVFAFQQPRLAEP